MFFVRGWGKEKKRQKMNKIPDVLLYQKHGLISKNPNLDHPKKVIFLCIFNIYIR
jgi:hypothetical protein